MPGFYVSNQSSGVGSGLAGAIAGIASNFNPENVARAANLAQSTQNLSWDNQLKSMQVPATRNAMNQILAGAGRMGDEVYNQPGGSIPSVVARATVNPAMSHGGDPYYVPATPGHPEDERGGVDYSKGGIFGGLAAQQIALGHGADETTKLLDYGHQVVHGPGTDITTGAAIKQASDIASNAPFSIGAGQVRHDPRLENAGPSPGQVASQQQQAQPPSVSAQPMVSPAAQPGAAPLSTGGGGADGGAAAPVTAQAAPVGAVPNSHPAPGTWIGPSIYNETTAKNMADADTSLFEGDEKAAGDALQTGNNLLRMQKLYNSSVNIQGLDDRIGLAAQNEFADLFGGQPISTKQQAIAAIKAQLQQQVGHIAAGARVTRMGQPEIAWIQSMLAQPELPAPVFNDIMNAMRATAQQDAELGTLNSLYRRNPTPENATNLRDQRQRILGEDPLKTLRNRYPDFADAEKHTMEQQQAGGGGAAAADQTQTVTPPPPAVGTIKPDETGKNRRYNGGPPHDPASWDIVP